ncbi:MAG: transposase [Saprospiraceae bacterium]|nr:transposase [Saprospiraceae bacterium]
MQGDTKGYKIGDQYETYFLTFTVVGWVDVFTRQECRDIIIDSFKYCQKNKGLIINAYVVMSSHIHLICRAVDGSEGLSGIIRDFKKFTSKKLLEFILNDTKESRKEWMKVVFQYHAKYNSNNTKYQVWQQKNQPKVLLNPKFISQKLTYIHNNPVVENIVEKQEDYLYSSARNYLEIDNYILEVELIDFGSTEGYIPR